MVIILCITCLIGFILGFVGYGKPKTKESIIQENEFEQIQDEITQIEILIERRKEIARIVENELENTTSEKRKAVLLSKLNTLDSQTFRDYQKINKLLEKT